MRSFILALSVFLLLASCGASEPTDLNQADALRAIEADYPELIGAEVLKVDVDTTYMVQGYLLVLGKATDMLKMAVADSIKVANQDLYQVRPDLLEKRKGLMIQARTLHAKALADFTNTPVDSIASLSYSFRVRSKQDGVYKASTVFLPHDGSTNNTRASKD